MIDMNRIVEFGQRIGREFHPDKVVLFGSYASGQARADSNVDMLACQPGEAARRHAEGGPLIRTALDHGQVLYERND